MFDIPKFTIQDSVDKYLPPQVSLTLEEIRQLSDDELLMLLSGEGRDGVIPAPLLQAISYELTSRQIQRASKPHWTIKPAFYLLIIAVFLAAIPIGVSTYKLVSNHSVSSNNHTNESEEIKTNSKP